MLNSIYIILVMCLNHGKLRDTTSLNHVPSDCSMWVNKNIKLNEVFEVIVF